MPYPFRPRLAFVFSAALLMVAARPPARAAVIQGSFFTGAGGTMPTVNRFDAVTQSQTASFVAYPLFNGGVHVAAGDVNNDGVADFITGPEAGTASQVRVFDGANPASMLIDTTAYSAFTGGVYVASADFTHDNRADLVTGPGAGGQPNVKVINSQTLATVASFFAYSVSFTGGVTVAAGDVNDDGTPDIITAPASGAAPNVKVFDGVSNTTIASFNAYAAGFTGGVFVAAGDVNGDGFADIITGAGAGGLPELKVFSGANTSVLLGDFLAYGVSFTGGVRVAAADLTGDGRAEIITAPGAGSMPTVEAFDPSLGFAQVRAFEAYSPSFTDGVFVAGTSLPEPGGPITMLVLTFAAAFAASVRRRRRDQSLFLSL